MSCSDLLWDARQIRGKHIPTIQDAFLCCDEQTLLLTVEHLHASHMPGWADGTPQQRRVARKRMRRALESMRECPVRRKDGKGFGLFPEEHFTVHARMHALSIERCVRARLVDFHDMSLLDSSESLSGAGDASRQDPSLGMFGFLPWSIALSYRVWLEGPWICHERYMVLAGIFWQLTHQGFGDSGRAGGIDEGSPCAHHAPGAPHQAGGRRYVDTLSDEYPDTGKRSVACIAGDAAAVSVSPSQGSRPAASVSEIRCQNAADMGLLAADALEEAYLDKLLVRVGQLNDAAEKNLLGRLEEFAARRVA